MTCFPTPARTDCRSASGSPRPATAGRPWGENIAAGQRSVAEVMQDWLQSAGHCANIMNPLHAELGAAAAVSGTDARIYWAQVFARPREP
ncbi:MAG: CAP domain-containing protein [Xanthomonadaceae bacterium]|nr:CAP domain-containing protein [Xanthomonadaceae bacterium]